MPCQHPDMGPGMAEASERVPGRREVATAFAVQGGVFISLTTRLPALQEMTAHHGDYSVGLCLFDRLLHMIVMTVMKRIIFNNNSNSLHFDTSF